VRCARRRGRLPRHAPRGGPRDARGLAPRQRAIQCRRRGRRAGHPAARRIVAAIPLTTPCPSLPRTLECARTRLVAGLDRDRRTRGLRSPRPGPLARPRPHRRAVARRPHRPRATPPHRRRRAWSRRCWPRIARLCVHDEAFHPALFARLLDSCKADALRPWAPTGPPSTRDWLTKPPAAMSNAPTPTGSP
jgi:hypothetical protein